MADKWSQYEVKEDDFQMKATDIKDKWSQYAVTDKQERQAPPQQEPVQKQIVDTLISQREAKSIPGLYQNAVNMTKENPMRAIASGGMKGAVPIVGEMLNRGKSAVSNLALAGIDKKDPMSMMKDFVSGLSGDKVGQPGDVSRRILYERGLPGEIEEGLASATDSVFDLAVFNLFGGKAPNNFDKFSTSQARKAHGAIKTARDVLSNRYTKVFGSSYDDVIGNKQVVEALKGLPSKVRTEIIKVVPKNATRGDIVNAMKTVTRKISDGSYNKLAVSKDPSLLQRQLVTAKEVIKDVSRQGLDPKRLKALKTLDKRWGDVNGLGKRIDNLLWDKVANRPKTKAMLDSFTNKDRAGVREIFRDFANSSKSKDMRQVISELERYASREKAKKIAVEMAKWLGLAGGVSTAGYYGIKTIGGAITE